MLEVVSKIPVSSRLVPRFLENIIHKKIVQVALNTIEKLVDFIFSWIYCPYNSLYRAKLERVHHFKDGTPFFDCTIRGIAKVQTVADKDFIYLNEKAVSFNQFEIVFSRENKIECVAVEDDRQRAGWVQIIQHDIATSCESKPMEKKWSINTSSLEETEEAAHYYLAKATPSKKTPSEERREGATPIRRQLFQEPE